jgi:hypothetical protein
MACHDKPTPTSFSGRPAGKTRREISRLILFLAG